MMLYKGYAGTFEVDHEAGIIFGRVTGLRDVITFQGETVAEAIQAFRDSVDDYLEFCESRGESPEKPYSGRFLLRMEPSFHRYLSYLAENRRESINTLVEHALKAHYGAAPDDDEPRPVKPDPEKAADVVKAGAAVIRERLKQESPS